MVWCPRCRRGGRCGGFRERTLAIRTIDEVQARTKRLNDLVMPYVPQVLARARELLSDRSKWTEGTLARGEWGRHVTPYEPEAVQWCAVGAVEKCAYDLQFEVPELQGSDLQYRDTVMRLLSMHAQAKLEEYMREVAFEITGEYPSRAGIPWINDHSEVGGYKAVMQALYMATGVTPTIAAAVQRFAVEDHNRRREAALKGWRKRRAAKLHSAAVEEAASTPVVFGGTLPTTYVSVEKEAEIRV
jgi:hypothetical protein